jgi:hypothetical protein
MFFSSTVIPVSSQLVLPQKLQNDEVEEDKNGGTHRRKGRAKKLAKFWLGNLKGRNHLKEVGPARRILLK